MADLDQTEPQVTAHPDSTRDAHPETASPVTPPTELQPCPFCGGEASFRYHPRGGTVEARCPAGVHHVASVGAPTQAAAIAAWNTRAPGKVEGKWEAVNLGEDDAPHWAVTDGDERLPCADEREANTRADALNRADALLKGGKP